ncbi:MAG: hypothetical protein K2L01_07890, partial [Rikenellaceae bacterium]|nr:hypothetical protein [Rikenellaceae bacterium]
RKLPPRNSPTYKIPKAARRAATSENSPNKNRLLYAQRVINTTKKRMQLKYAIRRAAFRGTRAVKHFRFSDPSEAREAVLFALLYHWGQFNIIPLYLVRASART